MGVPTSEVGYTSATTGREDHEVHKRHVVTLAKMKLTAWITAVVLEYLISVLSKLFFPFLV
jgi:hypothetical protein